LNRPTLDATPGEAGISRQHPLGQLRDSFIISTSPEGLLLIDQHAAHERILFERFRKAISEGKVATQPLLVPEIIELTPAQTATFDGLKDELQAMGFELGELSGRSVSVTALPADIPPAEAHALVLEILEIAEIEKRSLTIEKLRDRIAASLACRAAIKVNMPLTDQMMSWLIEELFKTAAPSNCPHGRPTVVKMTLREIERLFHR
jgi:DNA mismatch repair protein MutL